MKSGSMFGDIGYTEKREAFVRELVARIGILLGLSQIVLFFQKNCLELYVLSKAVCYVVNSETMHLA